MIRFYPSLANKIPASGLPIPNVLSTVWPLFTVCTGLQDISNILYDSIFFNSKSSLSWVNSPKIFMTARHDQLTMGLTAVLNRRVVVLTLFFFVLLSIARSDKDGSDDEPVGNYLYSEYEKDVVYPVVEYIAEDTGSGDSVNNTRERPDFLYSSKSGHRIVEFYAPWCPHW